MLELIVARVIVDLKIVAGGIVVGFLEPECEPDPGEDAEGQVRRVRVHIQVPSNQASDLFSSSEITTQNNPSIL